jgi:hypothetical protein
MMETSTGWTKYANVLGVLGLLTTVIYVNPIATFLPTILNHIHYLYDQAELTPGGPFDSLPLEYRNECPDHKFTSVRQLSRAPDVMIIEGFLTKFEADYLVDIA